jgi:hypothetical protein
MANKVGRPKVKKAEFKGILIGARFAPDEAKTVQEAVKRSKQGKSAWIRKALLQAAEIDKSGP